MCVTLGYKPCNVYFVLIMLTILAHLHNHTTFSRQKHFAIWIMTCSYLVNLITCLVVKNQYKHWAIF